MLREIILRGEAFHRGAIAVFLHDLQVALPELLSAAGQLPPAPALLFPGGDIEISALDVALELLYQLLGEKRLCVYIFHCGLPS